MNDAKEPGVGIQIEADGRIARMTTALNEMRPGCHTLIVLDLMTLGAEYYFHTKSVSTPGNSIMLFFPEFISYGLTFFCKLKI
jgi:hypothetical protein